MLVVLVLFGQGSFGRLNITNDDVNLYGNIGINTNLNVTEVLTATSFVGDGSLLNIPVKTSLEL